MNFNNMDYEKKYKETIEAVRKLSDANPSDEGIQNWVNENFPELKESEDEQIRKTLIEYFRVGANNNETTCNIEDKEILAWLEKQGEPFDDNIITRDDEVLQAISIGLTDAKKDLGWSDFGGLPIEEIQEWIEKQGEQKPAEWSEEDERKISLLDALCDDQINDSTSHSTMYTEMHELKDWLKSLKDRVQPKQEWSEEDSMHLTNAILAAEKEWGIESHTSKWLKSLRPQKQCKQSEEQEKIRKALYIYLDWLDGRKDCAPRGEYTIRDMIAWLEKQGEEKPGDKVKPKYKIGDWIIFDENHNGVYQVEKIDNYRYYLRHYLGYASMTVHFDNQLIRPWTIQDAKDGDVLVTDDKQLPFIYKGCLDPKHPDSPVAYCGIDSDGIFFISEGNHWWTVEKVHPATKEQRDFLFINIKEDGYVWDAEKKELKKIEQKIANKVEPKFNVGDTIVAKDFYECAIGTIKDIKGEQYIFTDGSGINIDEQDEWKLVKTSTNIEQKIDNKIEPKFHEDDWTVSNLDGKARRISEVHFDEYNSYYVVDGKSVNLEEYDRLHHLWSIKDAKDGDVLVCNINKAEIGGDVEKLPNITPTICIYQNVVKDEDYIHSYCSLYDRNFLALQNTMYYNAYVYNIHPASEEERDLLFQKMREEGCEWNSEKKEVKSLIFYRAPIKFPNFIGLGLPSGTLWADRNLGADTPEESGDYYRFGETVPFTKNSPEYVYDEIKGRSIAGTEKDVATKLLGKEYSMPTLEQIKELIDKCEWEWIEEDGIKGMKVTGVNGNSIFLPASGYCYSNKGTFCNAGSNGDFWSASVDDDKYSRGLYFYLDNRYCSNCDRASGFPIRAVANR